MKRIRVVIRLIPSDQPKHGFLEARIEREGRLGDDLLAKWRVKDKDKAVQLADKQILKLFSGSQTPLVELPAIDYEVEELASTVNSNSPDSSKP